MNNLLNSVTRRASLAAVLVSMALYWPAADAAEQTESPVKLPANAPAADIHIEMDATSLPRKLLTASLTLPVPAEVTASGGSVALWYPKWVPGSHGPGGPLANLAGLKIHDGSGNTLLWTRTPGEFHRVVVEVAAGTQALAVDTRYITNQPTTNSMGHDSFGSPLLGIVSPSTVLFYVEGMDIDAVQVSATLVLPDQWKASTALPALARQGEESTSSTSAEMSESADAGSTVLAYQPVSLRTFVDSPIMCGKYRRTYELVDAQQQSQEGIPPHRLHVFSEAESVLEIDSTILTKLKQMVTQSGRLFQSFPFEQFDILLATTDVLPRNGLEHARSSFNVLGQRTLQSPIHFKGWDRLLIPHEYLHAWCGKYRRPAGMVTTDFHSAKATDLLWVYEGLTQYLGELVEVRSGLMKPQEFRNRLAIEVRSALLQQGRDWRSLSDTGSCSHLLRAKCDSWPRLRRSQDYYMEGMLFWMECDAIIRRQTNGQKSLDDFCQAFFQFDPNMPSPRPFERSEVLQTLNNVVAYDWRGLMQRRIDGWAERFQPTVADELGFTIEYSNRPPDIPAATFRVVKGVDALDSIGALFDTEGKVVDLLLNSPADAAGLGPGMKIVGVNDSTWSPNRMQDAIAQSVAAGKIELMVVNADSFQTLTVPYRGGPRFMRLEPQSGATILDEIVKPLPPGK